MSGELQQLAGLIFRNTEILRISLAADMDIFEAVEAGNCEQILKCIGNINEIVLVKYVCVGTKSVS